MKQTYRAAAAVLTCAALLPSFPAYAAPTGPGAPAKADRYDEQTRARLEDNVIEYDEIELLVREYNTAISDAWGSYEDSKEDYERMVTELESQYRIVKDTADGYISMGEMLGSDTEMGATLIRSGKMLDSTYHGTMQGMRDAVKRWDTNLVNTGQIRKAERQVTAGVQQAMIGYDTIQSNLGTLETMVNLYERKLALTERMAANGLATGTDVLSDRSSLLGARSNLAGLQVKQEEVRRTLCSLLGYDPETCPEIRRIPEFDMNRLAGMNLAEDTRKAIGNNFTLISQRTSAKGKTSAQIDQRLAMINEGDEKVTIEIQRLYQDVMDKKAAYDAAMTGYAAAELSHSAAKRQYGLGLISEVQYIGTELAYCQKKAEKEAANLNLLQAMETYDWGIMGFATVE